MRPLLIVLPLLFLQMFFSQFALATAEPVGGCSCLCITPYDPDSESCGKRIFFTIGVPNDENCRAMNGSTCSVPECPGRETNYRGCRHEVQDDSPPDQDELFLY